ncbi:hypothetical protein [Streptomyces sp. NPDC001880]
MAGTAGTELRSRRARRPRAAAAVVTALGPVGTAAACGGGTSAGGVGGSTVVVAVAGDPGSSHLFLLGGRPSHREDCSRRLVEWVTTHTDRRTKRNRSTT